MSWAEIWDWPLGNSGAHPDPGKALAWGDTEGAMKHWEDPPAASPPQEGASGGFSGTPPPHPQIRSQTNFRRPSRGQPLTEPPPTGTEPHSPAVMPEQAKWKRRRRTVNFLILPCRTLCCGPEKQTQLRPAVGSEVPRHGSEGRHGQGQVLVRSEAGPHLLTATQELNRENKTREISAAQNKPLSLCSQSVSSLKDVSEIGQEKQPECHSKGQSE